MSKPLGGHAWTSLAGPAILLISLLSTSAVNAAFDLDAPADGDRITVARETLATAVPGRDASGQKTGKTYYQVTGATGALNVTGNMTFAKVPGSVVTIKLELRNAALAGDPLMSDDIMVAGASAILRSGGGMGDSVATFLVGNTLDFVKDAEFTVSLSSIAVSPTTPASIVVTVTDSLDGTTFTKIYPNAVRAMPAVMGAAMAMDAEATVSTGFESFGAAYSAPLGSFEIKVMPDYINASDGEVVTPAQLINPAATSATGAGSDVTFSGDFSFAKMVTLDPDTACSAGTNDLLMRDENGLVSNTMELNPVAAATLIEVVGGDGTAGMKYLCIHVPTMDDEMMAEEIPETDPYTVMTSYAGLTPNAKFPPPDGSYMLGKITRDGTTVRIPYLTQFANYNQRVVITNRGPAADYEFTFDTEDGVTAAPGGDATGAFPADSVTYISLMNGDLVDIQGMYNRAVATLTVATEPRHIDVIVSQTNANGGTDTIRYPDDNERRGN